MPQFKKYQLLPWTLAGIILVPALWWFATNVLKVSPRYLPSISSVAGAWIGLNPTIGSHFGATTLRLMIGFTFGTITGVGLALATARYKWLDSLLFPTINSMRAVPAAAIVPFFLLWFGFSEVGRYLLATIAVAFNVAVAAREILNQKISSHEAFFQSFKVAPASLTFRYALPRIAEGLLPTLRYSLALALGAVTVSELLGSQIGMGYLLQTARSTFSFHLLFLSMILLGILSVIADFCLCLLWKRLIYWRINK